MTDFKAQNKAYIASQSKYSNNGPSQRKQSNSKMAIKARKVKDGVYHFFGLDYWFPKNGLF